MTTASVPGFLPSTHGFHFGNDFPSEPVGSISVGFFSVPIGDASNGVCGGMAYAVRDMFEAGVPVPDVAMHPALNTPLYAYLVRRLFDSFDIPGGVLEYLAWQSPLSNQFRDTVG